MNCKHNAQEERWIDQKGGIFGSYCLICGKQVSRSDQPKLVQGYISMDISSGFGIGGYGSDDHNMDLERDHHQPSGKPRLHGGGQRWEPCPICGREPVHLDCGYCEKHCRC